MNNAKNTFKFLATCWSEVCFYSLRPRLPVTEEQKRR